jgi:hypothetical protein
MEKNMKRFRKITTAIAVLILLVSAAAAAPLATYLGVNDATGNPGIYVEVPVNITNVQNDSIYGIIFTISFDSSVINLTKPRVKRGDLTLDWDSPGYNPITGQFSIVAGDITKVIQAGSGGSVIILNFSVVGAPGAQSAMDISNIQISNETGGVGTAPAKNGIFKIPGGNVRDNVITLTPVTTQNNVGQNHTVIANVTNSTGAPQNGVLVNFSVLSGPNSGVNGSDTTNKTGKAKFTYTGSNVTGVDQIKACFTGQNNTQICSQVVTKEWINQTINQTTKRPTEIIDNMTGIPLVNESTVNILAEDFMNFTAGDHYNITITRVSDGVVEFNKSGTLLGWPKQTITVNWTPSTKGDYILRSEANTMAETRTVLVINQKVISPVPELSALVLVSAGILGLFGLARRRNS